MQSSGETIMSTEITDWLDVVAKILLRCWIFGFVLLFIWFGVFLSGAVHGLHGPLMDLSDHDLNVIHYSGMALLKLVVICFFFFPWAAIRLVLRKTKA
jgi:hypothetical protein